MFLKNFCQHLYKLIRKSTIKKTKQNQMSELDIRSALRLIIITSRSLTLVLIETKSPNQIDNILNQKNLLSTEIKIYIHLLKYSLNTLLISQILKKKKGYNRNNRPNLLKSKPFKSKNHIRTNNRHANKLDIQFDHFDIVFFGHICHIVHILDHTNRKFAQ